MECNIKDTSINYEIIGEGKSILFLHGYYSDKTVMTAAMEPIFSKKDGYKRIYLDLPGMGKSESANWINNSDKMLDIVIEFIEKIIPDEKFLIAGISYGGYLARGVIYKLSDRIDGTALICPIVIPEYKKRNLPEHLVLVKDEILLSKLTPEEAEDFNDSLVVQSERIYDRYQYEVMSGVTAANSDFLQIIMKNGYGFSFDVDSVPKFDKPALILSGKQDDSVGYKDIWNLIENYPRATFSVIDCAGHNLQIEQEELFNSFVQQWLLRVEVCE